jgi:hypothetical protein
MCQIIDGRLRFALRTTETSAVRTNMKAFNGQVHAHRTASSAKPPGIAEILQHVQRNRTGLHGFRDRKDSAELASSRYSASPSPL